MAEYIEREAVLATMCKYCCEYDSEDTECTCNERLGILEIPAADVAPVVHGEWEEYPDRSHLRCTNCKIEFERIKMPSTRHYCPNCGADMRERKGDDAELN